MKHICLFDIDGTLLNTGGAGQLAMERALAREFNVHGPYTDIPSAGRTDRAITSDLFAFHKLEISPEDWQRFITTYFALLPEAMGELDGRVLPGIVNLLNALADRGDVALGLLTGNFREGAMLKLRHYDIHSHFSFGGFGDEHFDRDDVARVALTDTIRFLNRQVEPTEVLVIGDTPNDVKCARAIGARAVAVGTGIFTYEQLQQTRPDHLFGDFSEYTAFLDLLK
jgi:phosphoglycolate phosphatase-like HAD superfamily hydrolase